MVVRRHPYSRNPYLSAFHNGSAKRKRREKMCTYRCPSPAERRFTNSLKRRNRRSKTDKNIYNDNTISSSATPNKKPKLLPERTSRRKHIKSLGIRYAEG
jgi:hypothetical protein